jgi:hypothetical protein
MNARERRAPLREEHLVALGAGRQCRPHLAQIARDPRDGFVAHRHETLLAALADHAHHTRIERDLRRTEKRC